MEKIDARVIKWYGVIEKGEDMSKRCVPTGERVLFFVVGLLVFTVGIESANAYSQRGNMLGTICALAALVLGAACWLITLGVFKEKKEEESE